MGQYPSPVYPNFGDQRQAAVNSGFDNIMQGMQQAQQQKMADIASIGQTGSTQGQLLGGQKIADEFAGTELTPENAGNVITPQQKDMWQHFQEFTAQGKQKAQAGVADTISQANLRNTTANMNNVISQNYGGQGIPLQALPGQNPQAQLAPPPSGLGAPNVQIDPKTGREYTMAPSKAGPQVKWLPSNAQELSPERQSAYEWAIKNGILTQNQLRSRGPATNAMLDGVINSADYKAAQSAGGGTAPQTGAFSPAQSEINFAAKKAAAVAPYGSKAFSVQAGAQSLLTQIPDALNAAKAIGSGDIVALNKINQVWGTQISDQNWDELRDRAATIADEFQAQIGAGSDKKLDLAVNLISTTKSPANIVRALNIVQQVAQSRKDAFGGNLGNSPASPKSALKSAGSSERQVQLVGPDGKPRMANFNGKKFAGWADGGK